MNKKLLKGSIVLMTLVFGPAVLAEIYKRVDEKGFTHFSNKPSVEERSTIVGADKKEAGQSSEQQAAPEDVLKAVDSALESKAYSKAMSLLKPLAERGHPRAQNGLGLIYDQGLGVPKNLNEASKWYRKAAEQGYVPAQSFLAAMYAKGEGVPKDSVEAAKWYQKAAENGHDFAQHNLGLMYAKGEGVSQNLEKAFKWIRKATAQGYPLHFDFEPGWKVGHYAELPSQSVIIEFIREEDDINNWKELLTIQNFPPLWGGPSPEAVLSKLKAIREKVCPGVTKWNVIDKNESSILYEWQAKPCLGWPDQQELARIIYGKYNTFILHYAMKTRQMPAEQRAKWIKRLSDAK